MASTTTLTPYAARVMAARFELAPGIRQLLWRGNGEIDQELLDALVEKVAEQFRVKANDLVG